jgi:hypothetical protein
MVAGGKSLPKWVIFERRVLTGMENQVIRPHHQFGMDFVHQLEELAGTQYETQ